ncbi:MAG: hypothetical protein U5J83_16990 [Bryobacterales bacterium]|nr:hypothetical protein [Bryobacterales bacterium]
MSHLPNLPEINHIPAAPLTPGGVEREALTRALESQTFRRSPRLREFLDFVGTLSLEGRDTEITEQRIGVAVFQRGSGFSPAEDNIVRATARALRTKLREYYDTEGATESCRIEIPKGSYVPHFVSESPGKPPMGNGGLPAPNTVRTTVRILGAALAVSLVFSAYLLWKKMGIAAAEDLPAPPASLLARVFPNDCTVTIVASDALHTQLQFIGGSLSTTTDYAARTVFQDPPPSLAGDPALWDLIRTQSLTNADDVRAAVRLARSVSSNCDVEMSHARSVGIGTFQRGGNFIILAGRRANPWAGLFEKNLEFEMVFPTSSESAIFRNLHPKEGEQTEYEAKLAKQTGVAYGRVAVMPGLYGSGRVVLVAGTTGETTFAATDFLTQPRGLVELEKRLGHLVDASVSRLEVLIETSAVSGGTNDFRVVAVR